MKLHISGSRRSQEARMHHPIHPEQSDQLALPLPQEGWNEDALRTAYRSTRVRIPFEAAMRDRALAICLRCLSEARRKRRELAAAGS